MSGMSVAATQKKIINKSYYKIGSDIIWRPLYYFINRAILVKILFINAVYHAMAIISFFARG